jgi:transcriptional regulator with XRE-family HTH domain
MDDRPASRGRSYDVHLTEAVGRTIKVLRTDLGLGRKDLATRAGISYSYLTEIENGNKPASTSVLVPIADALGLQLHELIAAAEARLAPEPATEDQLFTSQGAEAFWEESRQRGVAPPSVRRRQAYPSLLKSDRRSMYAQPGMPPHASTRDLLRELEELFPLLNPEDQRRVVDLVRRLTG